MTLKVKLACLILLVLAAGGWWITRSSMPEAVRDIRFVGRSCVEVPR